MPVDVVPESLGDQAWRVILRTQAWTHFSASPSLAWRRVRFSRPNQRRIPKRSGLYAFITRPRNKQLPRLGDVMYVGQTGAKSGRTLYDRFGDYLQWMKGEKRPLVRAMFGQLSGALEFHFATVGPSEIGNLANIETKLLDTLIPPCNDTGFSAEIAHAVKVIWRR